MQDEGSTGIQQEILLHANCRIANRTPKMEIDLVRDRIKRLKEHRIKRLKEQMS
jgi:hypothetical protein